MKLRAIWLRPIGGIRIVKCIFSIFKEAHVGMHTGTGLPKERLGHKGGADAMRIRSRFYHHFKGMDIVCSRKSLAVLKIDFMLGDSTFMMGRFNLKSHVLKSQADIAPAALSHVGRPHVKIAGRIIGDGGGMAVLVPIEKEEFAFRPHVEGISHLRRFLQ